MAVEIIGRDEELSLVHAFLGRAGEGPGALVLEGDAGIGKSTLWLAGVEAAREQGLRVLVSRPAEAERTLAFAGLGDLFDGLLDEVLPSATPPQRRALEVALLVREAEGVAVDSRAVGLAVRSALQLLSQDGPLVVAVDDTQWLDSASSASIAFSLRRLADANVLLLLARRTGEATASSGLDIDIEPERLERLVVGPLSLGAVHRLLRPQLGRMLPRPTLLRVHEVSGGNPFYALELARTLDPDFAGADPTQPFRVPETLEGLIGARLQMLPAATRDALLLAATVERPSQTQLQAAGVPAEVVEPAVVADLIQFSDDAIRFTHPLLASVLYQQASDGERRRAHAVLADVVDDEVPRARHLALASDRPDPELAAIVEQAAISARARGAAAAAAELGEHAARSTPPADEDERRRRLLQAGLDHLAAGAPVRAQEIGARVLQRAKPGRPRAEALALLGHVELMVGLPSAAVRHLNAALAERPDAPELEFLAHERLAWSLSLTAAEPHADAASELAASLGESALTARALAVQSRIHFGLARPDAFELAERAVGLARSADDPTALAYSREALVHCLFFGGRLAEAHDIVLDMCRWGAQHDETALGDALWYLALVEYRAGRWSLAREHGERQHELGGRLSVDGHDESLMPLPLLLVSAASGDGSVVALAERGLAVCGERRFDRWAHRSILATLAHWNGDPARAAEYFAVNTAEQTAAGTLSVLRWLFRPEEIEALLALGRTQDAVALLEPWQAEAKGLDLRWPLAETTRCRGFLAAARGEVEEAVALFERAVAEHEAVGDPFGLARAQLALGTVQRRARRKRAAREAIETAVAGFDELGAAQWAKKARAELGRIGGRRPTEGLTAAETRVAALAAEGRTNREIAAALFLGERTVESHLSHIYAKLGLRSRTELARTLSLTSPRT